MEQPQGFEQGSNMVCRLKKALYGLKQASRAWHKKASEFLASLEFKKSNHDEFLSYKRKGGSVTYVVLYVDDFFVFSNEPAEVHHLKEKLSRKFPIRDLGLASSCLGMQVTRKEDGSVLVNQADYAAKVIKRFGMENSNPVSTPLEPHLQLEPAPERGPEPYQEVIGSLMYLAVATRPDLAYAVSYLTQFNTSHGQPHWIAAK